MQLNTNIVDFMQGKLNMLSPEVHSMIRLYWATDVPQSTVARSLKHPIEIVNIYYAVMDADFYLDNGEFPSEWSKKCLGSAT